MIGLLRKASGVVLLVILVSAGTGYGQALKQKSSRTGPFFKVYEVLASDTAIKHGRYQLFYKDKIIENGRYGAGRPCCMWQYFSLDGVFEFEYDFDEGRLVKLSGERGEQMHYQTPCLFLGSPIVPYIYIVDRMNYPEKAKDLEVEGRVVLALKINKKGELWSMYLYEKLHPLLDSEVMRVARTIPDHWEWLAATRKGIEVNGEYHIAIEFEMDYRGK